MPEETEVLTLIDLPEKSELQDGDYFPVGNSTQDYRVSPSTIGNKLGVPAIQSGMANKADKDLGNVDAVAQNSPVATKQDVTAVNNTAQSALTKAEQAQNSVSNLQTQINSLNTEVSKMLGRMNFSSSIGFSLAQNQTFTCPQDGYVIVTQYGDPSSYNDAQLYINGVRVLLATSANGNDPVAFWIPVSANDVLSTTNDMRNRFNGAFVPQK